MAADDPFVFRGAPGGPYVDVFAVTPSDTVDFEQVTNGIWVATAQTALTVVTQMGTVLDLGAVPAATFFKLRCKRINSTGTSPGTGIVGFI